MKVLDYQLQNIKEQANDISEHYGRVDKDIKEFEEFCN